MNGILPTTDTLNKENLINSDLKQETIQSGKLKATEKNVLIKSGIVLNVKHQQEIKLFKKNICTTNKQDIMLNENKKFSY